MLQVGDTVVARTPKVNKFSSYYDPKSCQVTKHIKGTMIIASRPGQSITRNISFFKKITATIPRQEEEEDDAVYDDDTVTQPRKQQTLFQQQSKPPSQKISSETVTSFTTQTHRLHFALNCINTVDLLACVYLQGRNHGFKVGGSERRKRESRR